MQYTLWSRGVLIGETDFALGSLNGPRMAGIFHPAVSGMMLLPTLTAMAPAILGLTGALKRVNLTPADAACDPDAVFAAIADSPEGQQM